ncbi:periphilin-1 isoform X2 [Octodon degus]|uniref:Periphilin-1 isoform X2 n=1 Tax=Octodon degus TaxID=10160 RepID=A0A6P6F3U7_OCTDE|nr:periphilin-1 isoform X2 [Octodon degus]
MFNFAASSFYGAHACQSLLGQPQAPALLGAQPQPAAASSPNWWFWNPAPPASGLLADSFPALPAATTPGPQPLLVPVNSSASRKKNKRPTEAKKVEVTAVVTAQVVAVPPVITEQQTDEKKSMEESTEPTAAPAGEGDPMADRRNEMWSEGRYDYDRVPRERAPPRSHPADGYHRVVNIVPKKPPLLEKKPPLLEKKPPLLEKKPPLLEKKPPLLDRPGEGSYSRYYSHVAYREYDEGRSFSHDRRSGPPHRGDESGYRWSRDDHSSSRQSDYRDMRDGFRRKSFYSSHYARDRSPHTRDPPFFRDSPVGRKDSPHSRSGSSVSSRSYSPDRSKPYSFHQSQHRKPARACASYKRQNEGNPERGKDRSVQSLKTSRDTSPSSSPAGPSSKVGPTTPLFPEQPEEPETSAADSTELFEDSQLSSRTKAIALKTKEIEQIYRQDCETFGMVVKMLIEKDPSLEKSIQFALRQNLHEIGERCVEELKHFIAEYDTSQDFGEPF